MQLHQRSVIEEKAKSIGGGPRETQLPAVWWGQAGCLGPQSSWCRYPGVPCDEPGMSGSELCRGSRPICQLESCFLSAAAAAKSLQLRLTLCDPMDSSPPGSSLHGILQARILEWVAISFSSFLSNSIY